MAEPGRHLASSGPGKTSDYSSEPKRGAPSSLIVQEHSKTSSKLREEALSSTPPLKDESSSSEFQESAPSPTVPALPAPLQGKKKKPPLSWQKFTQTG